MSFAILHISSGLLFIDPMWEDYASMSRVHAEYYIHAFNHEMVPMNQLARNFRNWCNNNNISIGSDLNFEILEDYECISVDPIEDD